MAKDCPNQGAQGKSIFRVYTLDAKIDKDYNELTNGLW